MATTRVKRRKAVMGEAPRPIGAQVPLREYVEALLEENKRALEMADSEREKAAAQLRLEMKRAISEGDDRLREHIHQQVLQIEAALASAEKLEVQRIAGVKSDIEGMSNAVSIASEASEKAINKAEMAAEKRFESVNEFRGQLSDQVRTFMPREVADGLLSQLNKRISLVEERTNLGAGATQGRDRMIAWAIGGSGILIAAISIVANYLTSH